MVVNKSIQLHIATDTEKTAYGMGNFEIIVVVVPGEQPFVKLIVGNGMQHLAVGPAAVVTVDDLAHQPEVGFQIVAYAT